MRREFRVIRNNGNTTDWVDMKDWDIERICIFAGIMYAVSTDDWQIEYRTIVEE